MSTFFSPLSIEGVMRNTINVFFVLGGKLFPSAALVSVCHLVVSYNLRFSLLNSCILFQNFTEEK